MIEHGALYREVNLDWKQGPKGKGTIVTKRMTEVWWVDENKA